MLEEISTNIVEISTKLVEIWRFLNKVAVFDTVEAFVLFTCVDHVGCEH